MIAYQYPELQENQHDSGTVDNRWWKCYYKESNREWPHWCGNNYCLVCKKITE
jgi:hypothetical protein